MVSISAAPQLSSKSTLPSAIDVSNTLNLSDGEIVDGRVLKQLSAKEFLIGIRGFNIKAHSAFPLYPGMRLSLMRVAGHAIPTLKVLNFQASGDSVVNLPVIRAAIDDNVWGRLYKSLDALTSLSSSQAAIKAVLTKVMQSESNPPSSEGIKSLITASGLSWESKLLGLINQGGISSDILDAMIDGDLKGAISKALMQMQDDAPVLKSLMTALDNLQLLNFQGSDQPRAFFLPLPLQFDSGAMAVAQILIRFPREDASASPESNKEKQYSVVMQIELSSLGAIRVELVLTGKKIQGRFMVDRQNTLEQIEHHIASFFDMLQNRGYTLGYIGCQLVETGETRQNLVDEILPQQHNSICIVA